MENFMKACEILKAKGLTVTIKPDQTIVLTDSYGNSQFAGKLSEDDLSKSPSELVKELEQAFIIATE